MKGFTATQHCTAADKFFSLFVSPTASQASQASEEPKPAGAYRPPAYRAPGRRGPGPVSKSKMPEIDSEIAFPSLSAAMATNKRLVEVIIFLNVYSQIACPV